MMIKIALGLAVIVWGIGIVSKVKRGKIKKLKVAAYDIMKEEALNEALQNQWLKKDQAEQDTRVDGKKIMIHLEVKGSKPVISYVFNPEKTIHIGRNKDSNTICLKDTTVSGQHCDIYAIDGRVYIKDLGSSNMTLVKRRGRITQVENLKSVELLKKDLIFIGATCFKIILFECDTITF